MSDYLFDKQGDPDPEIERLEELLAPMAYRGAVPRLRRAPRRAPMFVVAAAAIALAAALVAVLIGKPWRPRPPSSLVAQWIDTGETAVRLDVGIGTVELAPHTRARTVAGGPTRREMQLEHGTLTATIHAPPRQFVVRTPRAVVTDLGCAFEVSVDATGRGRVTVTEGRVAVAGSDAQEVVVPAGANVELSAAGPGVPHVPTPAQVPTPESPSVPAEPATPVAPMTPHHHAGAHAIKKPAHATKTIAAPPPTHPQQPHTTTPPRKNESPSFEHDALKDLKNSGE